MHTMTARTTAVLAAVALAAAGLAIEHADAHRGGDDGPPGRSVAQEARAERNLVDVTVTDHSIDLPEEIPAGWTTFRFHNRSDEVHFGVLELLPEGITVQDSIDDVVPVFQDGMDRIIAEDPNAFDEFANLPAWYFDVVFMGGPGLVAPGETAVVTVDLQPGTYAVECYVKTDGVFHSSHGMIAGLTVTEEESARTAPTADVTVTVSGVDGFAIDGEFRPGRQTIAVRFADQAPHGNFLGHDLHIARVGDDPDLDALGTWMSWITGLDGTPPAHFLGGTHEMPADSTAYVDVTLRPGTYVLVSEVDAPASKGLLETITIK